MAEANGDVHIGPEAWVQSASHIVALPSAAAEVQNVITLQKSPATSALEGEKKTITEKMMVRRPHVGLWLWGREGMEVLSPPTDENWKGGLRWEEAGLLDLSLNSTSAIHMP